MTAAVVTAPCPVPKNRGAQLLRAWRDEQSPRETQMGLAIKIGINPQTISTYERGESLPSRHHAIMMRDVTGIPVEAWDEPAQTDHITTGQHGGTR